MNNGSVINLEGDVASAGVQGYSAYEIAVRNGFVGTEEEWVNSFLSPDGYLKKRDIIDNLSSSSTINPLSAKQGKLLSELIEENDSKIASEANTRQNADNDLQSQISALTEGRPLIASSIEDMTDTSRLYINTTDGNWYYYDGTNWSVGGVYQSTSDYNIVKYLDKTYININYDKVLWTPGGYYSDGTKHSNQNAIRYAYFVPKNVKFLSIPEQNHKIYLCRYIYDETEVHPYTFVDRIENGYFDYELDQDNYLYTVYIMRTPTSTSINVDDDYLKIKFYAPVEELNAIKSNTLTIEQSKKNLSQVPISTSDWEQGGYSADGVKNNNTQPTFMRLANKIPENIKEIKAINGYKFVISEVNKTTNIGSRLFWLSEFQNFDHESYNYYIYMYVNVFNISYTPTKSILFFENVNNLSTFMNNIDVDYQYDSTTNANYTVIRIYKNKIDGSKQFPFVYAPNGDGAGTMSTLRMMNKNNFFIGINAGLFHHSDGTKLPIGYLVENGVIIQEEIDTERKSYPLTIDSSGNLSYCAYNADLQDLITNDNIVSVVSGWYPIIENYVNTNINFIDIESSANTNAQRQIIGQFGNGDYCIITCEGRNYNHSDGWTIAEAQTICKKIGLKFAYNLDGGGSTETVIGKKQINSIYENNDGRIVPTYIVFNGTNTFDTN